MAMKDDPRGRNPSEKWSKGMANEVEGSGLMYSAKAVVLKGRNPSDHSGS